jgi:hypothetical protein
MSELNPTASSEGGASTPSDPVDLIQNFLDAQDGDSTQDTTAQDATKTPDTPKGDAPADDSEPQITTAQLAAYLGIEESEIDVDGDGQPVFKTKVDGKEGAAKFADIRKSHQLGVHAENRAREAAAKEQAAERKLQEAEQVISARFAEQQATMQQMGQFAQVLQHELNGEVQQQQWDQLWEQNPAQARKLERYYSERQARINGIMQNIAQRDQQARQQAAQAQRANEEQGKANQYRLLTKLIPEWNDPQVANKERQELLSWIETSGFDASDLDLTKASQVMLVRETWKHRMLQQSRPAIENKVRTAPRLVKPGQAPQPEEGKQARLKALKQNIRNASPANSSKAFESFLLESGLAQTP